MHRTFFARDSFPAVPSALSVPHVPFMSLKLPDFPSLLSANALSLGNAKTASGE